MASGFHFTVLKKFISISSLSVWVVLILTGRSVFIATTCGDSDKGRTAACCLLGKGPPPFICPKTWSSHSLAPTSLCGRAPARPSPQGLCSPHLRPTHASQPPRPWVLSASQGEGHLRPPVSLCPQGLECITGSLELCLLICKMGGRGLPSRVWGKTRYANPSLGPVLVTDPAGGLINLSRFYHVCVCYKHVPLCLLAQV